MVRPLPPLPCTALLLGSHSLAGGGDGKESQSVKKESSTVRA